jgi:hypothetical protein
VSYILRDDQTPQAFQERQSLDVWSTQVGDSPLARASEQVESMLFHEFFSPRAKYDPERPEDVEEFNSEYFFIDLNDIRRLSNLNLPLTSMNLKIIQGAMKAISSKMVPIGTFWKMVRERIRSFFSLRLPSESFTDPSFQLQNRAKMFLKAIKNISAKPGVSASFDSSWKKFTTSDLENRIRWSDSFIWVNPSSLWVQRVDNMCAEFEAGTVHLQSQFVPQENYYPVLGY